MKESENKENITYSYSSDWIHKLENSDHWLLYWNQAKLVFDYIQEKESILELGVGSGFTANYLKSKGYKVLTMDIDKEKTPDICANIVDYNFESKVDHVLAFEIFEHIPFEEFCKVIKKLKTVINKYLIFSIPRNEKRYLDIEINTILSSKKYRFSLKRIRNKLTTDHHFWELDYKKFSKKMVLETLKKENFHLVSHKKIKAIHYLVFRNENF